MSSPISIALFLSAVLTAGTSLAAPIASEKDWVVSEDEWEGGISCSIGWEPSDQPSRVSFQYLNGNYIAWFPYLPKKYSGQRVTIYFDVLEGLGRSIFSADWDETNQSHVANLDQYKGNYTIAELISGKMGKRTYEVVKGVEGDIVAASVPFDDASLVGKDMLECISRSQQIEAKAAMSNLSSYDSLSPRDFVQLYRQQLLLGPEELTKTKVTLAFGYMYFLTASNCRDKYWAIDDRQVDVYKTTVSKIISAKNIDTQLKDHVWKYVNYAMQTEGGDITFSECEGLERFARVHLSEFYAPEVEEVPNPF